MERIGSPSGTAATPSPTASVTTSAKGRLRKSPEPITASALTPATGPVIEVSVSNRASTPLALVRRSVDAWARPTSVSSPTATTTARACPDAIEVPA